MLFVFRVGDKSGEVRLVFVGRGELVFKACEATSNDIYDINLPESHKCKTCLNHTITRDFDLEDS